MLCLSDLGGQTEQELMGAERELKKCWLKGQSASRIHHGQRPAPASCLPATLSRGPQARAGIPLPCLDLPPGPCQVRDRCPYWPPLVYTHTSTLLIWKLTSSKRPPLSSSPCLSPRGSLWDWESLCPKPGGVLFISGWRGHSGSPDVGPELGMEGAPETAVQASS